MKGTVQERETMIHLPPAQGAKTSARMAKTLAWVAESITPSFWSNLALLMVLT
jgi:hypothetical protein